MTAGLVSSLKATTELDFTLVQIDILASYHELLHDASKKKGPAAIASQLV